MDLTAPIQSGRPLLVVAVAEEATHLDTDLPVLVTGPGKVASGQSLVGVVAPLAPSERPSVVINVGSAGMLRDGLEGTHRVGLVRQHDMDTTALAALTGVNPAPAIRLGTGRVLATGDRFIQSSSDRDELAEQAELVDMEGYALAFGALLLRLPILIVKHVTDRADGGALVSWLDQVVASSHDLGRWLEENDLEGAIPSLEA